MKTIRIGTLTMSGLLLAAASSTLAQTSAARVKNEFVQQLKGPSAEMANGLKNSSTTADKKRVARETFNAMTGLIGVAIAGAASDPDFRSAVEEARIDKQVGGGDVNTGSTSLVAKGSVPSILGFAVENGAITRDESGTTLTFRGNPVGIIKALGKSGFVRSYDESLSDPATKFLKHLSFSLSFDTGRGPQPGTFSGDLNQLSSWSLRWDLINKRDPRDRSYKTRWRDLIAAQGMELTKNLSGLAQFFIQSGNPLADWKEAFLDTMATADPEKVEALMLDQLLVGLPAALARCGDDVKERVEKVQKSVSAFLLTRDNILEAAANGTIVTIEYTNVRKVDQPDLSKFNLIVAASPFNGKGSLTANASLTVVNQKPAGIDLKRIHDFQLAGQVDVPLGEVQTIGSFVLTISGKYERIMDDTVNPAGVMMATKGDIGFGQIKLTIPVKGSGVKIIPLSTTFANRSELIKEHFVRGNFGITFDLDTLFSKLHP